MPGPWYRALQNPTQIRVVNNVSEYDAAYTASANGDRIQFNAGTYVMNRIVQKELQLVANGHVTWHGKVRWKADNIWTIGMEYTFPDENAGSPVTLDGTVDACVVGGNNVSIINCWIHTYNLDARNCVLNPGGFGGTLFYGSIFHDSRHILYLQNQLLEGTIWIAHCYVGDVETAVEPSNAYNLHVNSTGSAANVQNIRIHESIVANGPSIYAGGGVSTQFAEHYWIDNFLYRTSIRGSNRPMEVVIDGNRFYETLFELSGGGGATQIGMQFLHGAGEGALVPPYVHNSKIINNLFYKPNDLNTVNYSNRTSRYISSGGREEGIAPWRDAASGDQYDNNSFYGFFRSSMHANNNNQVSLTPLSFHRTVTASQGHQWDTNSTMTTGAPPDYYRIWQNDYNPDRAMIAVWNQDGAGSVAVTLPRNGDIYEIHDQWGAASYSGSGSYNITPYASEKVWFGIIKYTGGAVPQFARPSADTNNPGTWVNQAGSGTNIYQSIDETSPDDADYIKSPSAPSTSVYVTKLTSVNDPVSSTGHVLRIRYNKDAAGGAQINLTVELRQAYTSEGALGTLIATRTYTNVSDTFVTATETLSGSEADTITDYTNLYLRFIATQV